jgi:glutamate carboxypeptidase
MKASLVLVEFALAALRALDLRPPRPIVVLVTSDEEIGSTGSRPLIEDLARQSAYALVVEPPLADGGLKTGRKGVARYTIEIVGRPAHAGVEPRRASAPCRSWRTWSSTSTAWATRRPARR